MYQFFSSLPESEINKRYLRTFRLKSFNRKFQVAIRGIPELNRLFPPGYEGSQLLTLSFFKLTEIYYSYLNLMERLSEERKTTINTLLSSVFNYSSNQSKIKKFLSNPENGFEIHNCVYCDIQHFQIYKVNGVVKLNFQADHVLDEGKCPLVNLSIHNFVPSCDVCNGAANKGSNTIGRTKQETLKISPKSKLNNFENDVEFYFTPSCEEIKDLKMFRGDVGWEINFMSRISEYDRTIALFHLRERYNAKKKYFGEYIFTRRNNPDTKIKRDAELLGIRFENRDEELFNWERNRRNYEPMEKCRKELIKQVFGKLPTG